MKADWRDEDWKASRLADGRDQRPHLTDPDREIYHGPRHLDSLPDFIRPPERSWVDAADEWIHFLSCLAGPILLGLVVMGIGWFIMRG